MGLFVPGCTLSPATRERQRERERDLSVYLQCDINKMPPAALAAVGESCDVIVLVGGAGGENLLWQKSQERPDDGGIRLRGIEWAVRMI